MTSTLAKLELLSVEELGIKFIRPKSQGKKPVSISSYIPTSTQITDTKKFGTICINETELKELDQNQKVPSQNLNLCFVGCVSTGKSMLLNALFCEQLSQCKIKRTTMVPAIFIENEKENENIISSEEIFKQIEEKNTEIIEKTESGIKMSSSEYSELIFNVGKLDINILEDAYVNVYDIPGLNDARTKDIYYSYLTKEFLQFNLIIFMVDIYSGLNTSDEMDIVKFIASNTRHHLKENGRKIYTLVVVNKADDMQLETDADGNEQLNLSGELKEMFNQVEHTVINEFTRFDVVDHLIGLIPICAIDSYLYRMIKNHGNKFQLSDEQLLKIGINEMGKKFSKYVKKTQIEKVNEILKNTDFVNDMIKLSGFSCLEQKLKKFLISNEIGSNLRIDNLLYELKHYPNIYSTIIDYDIGKIIVPTLCKKYIENIKYICDKYNNIFIKIKKINEQKYNELLLDFTKRITNGITYMICNENEIGIIMTYFDYITNAIEPYYSCPSYPEYPEYLKQQVISIILKEVSHQLTINSFIEYFSILEKINCFNKIQIEPLLNYIINNIRKENTITTNLHYLMNGEFIYTAEDLISIFDKFIKLDINISKIVRFIIMNNISRLSASELYIRQLLYYKYHELPIYHFINKKLQLEQIDIFELTINGLTDINLEDNKYKLDMYYLKYETGNVL